MEVLPAAGGRNGDGSPFRRQNSVPKQNRLQPIPSGNLLHVMGNDPLSVREDDAESQSSINSRTTATSSLAPSHFSFSSFKRYTSGQSEASSSWMYAKPEQTLVFLDWDNTLFPTSELLDLFHDEMEAMKDWTPRSHEASDDERLRHASEEVEAELELWRKAVIEYLSVIRQHCIRCRIITNSKNPWVQSCIQRFHPALQQFIDRPHSRIAVEGQHSMRVLYADEEIIEEHSSRMLTPSSNCCLQGCAHWLRKLVEREKSGEDQEEEMTKQKHAAMRREASEFYSRYRNQTWKNILCMGDAKYEHEAVRTLSDNRKLAAPSRERLRTKNIRFKKRPSFLQLAWNLRVAAVLHPVFVSFDGDLDVDFNTKEPLRHLAEVFRIPEIADLAMPSEWEEDQFSWKAAEKALWDLECHVRDWQETVISPQRCRTDSL